MAARGRSKRVKSLEDGFLFVKEDLRETQKEVKALLLRWRSQ